MIDTESVLDYMRQASYRPMAYNELVQAFELDWEAELNFSKIMGKLEKEGEIVRTRKDKYGLPEMMNIFKGMIKLSQRGYGILLPDDPASPEIFVYGRDLNGAMHGDKVMTRLHQKASGDQRPEGEVIRVITRANKELVGTFEKGKHAAQVIPLDARQIYPINVKTSPKLKVTNGDKVLVTITNFPAKDRYPEGKITEVFGKRGNPGVDVEIVIKKHGLRTHFPGAVIEEAKRVAQPVSDEEIAKRRDLRDLRMVTIDGEDAKDLDDAVSIEKLDNGYRLGVHIADVSYYVREDSKLDKEALERATSVYLIDKVLPMLPKELSNDVCSLNAQQDRQAMTCMMDIDRTGKVTSYDIFKSVIHVNERMTYTAVNKIITDNDQATKERYADLVDDFLMMKELADILRSERTARGALDFDFPESKVIVDENSFPIEIKKFERGVGEMLIEDFMIKANETVAEHLYWAEIPTLYRVHEKPAGESLEKLNRVLGVFGHKIQGNQVESYTFQKLLNDIKGTPQETVISLMVLRSMKHARYMPQELGHFGLGSKYYCHFTSPIRRYPDLIVHRVLSILLDGQMNGKKRAALEKRMGKYGEQSSVQETKAEEAERELIGLKKARYMEQFVGEDFDARISSVQPFGFFVELPNTVEGLVHISTIADDYYEFNDKAMTLIGTHTGMRYSIGDEVRVQLVRVDVDAAQIDFELV
ncbi:MAG: ribonuclease R [Bacillota bacterium]|nr:ribonuclease R [Bacillota bacterium]